MNIENQKRALIVGAGASGLVTAKELMDAGINEVTILEQSDDLGGVWRRFCWDSATLTSSKWMTEFGSFPMPDDYPDFLKPEQMVDYCCEFAKAFGITDRIKLGVTVERVEKKSNGNYDIIATDEIFENYDFVVLCTGLHGVPKFSDIPGIDSFNGEMIHGSEYKSPDDFRGKNVLCIGLGESGIGISTEISHVAAQTVVSSTSLTPAPRVQPYTAIPFDQIQYWPIGKFIKDYQEILTLGSSWYNRLPKFLKPLYARFHPALRLFPEPWLPKALVPYHWHGKYWPKPGDEFSHGSGNLTRPQNSSDDILYLVNVGKIVPQGRVTKFENNHVHFEGGDKMGIDAVVFNTGYMPTLLNIQLPGNWAYRHQELYKGCFHPDLPNMAFIGFVRPTIGSLPAMAEMQARFIAKVFSGSLHLPSSPKLKKIINRESMSNAGKCPVMQERFPHIYFFDEWMEEMADLIGCQPKIWRHLFSWKQMQAFLFGAPIPLRFRQYGPGVVKNSYENYAERVSTVYSTHTGFVLKSLLGLHFFYPHILSLIMFVFLYVNVQIPIILSVAGAFLFWTSYMCIDLFRFFCWVPFLIIWKKRIQFYLVEYTPKPKFGSFFKKSIPDYEQPNVFQNDNLAETGKEKLNLDAPLCEKPT